MAQIMDKEGLEGPQEEKLFLHMYIGKNLLNETPGQFHSNLVENHTCMMGIQAY
jgi:hypothetical protein